MSLDARLRHPQSKGADNDGLWLRRVSRVRDGGTDTLQNQRMRLTRRLHTMSASR